MCPVRSVTYVSGRSSEFRTTAQNNLGPWSASDQRRGVRAAVCGQLPRRLSADVAAIAAYQEQHASAYRERLVCRTTADRLRRRNADPRLQRDTSLLSEQAGSDHVHD